MSARWTRALAVGSVLLVALVAAVVSYAHIHDLAARSGEGWRSVLIPLSVDGMLLAATLAIVDRRRARRPAGWVPWTGLVLGLVASLAANVAAARPDLVAQLVAAWPPVALAVSIETLVIVLRNTAGDGRTGPEPGADGEVDEPADAPPAPVGEPPDWWADAPPAGPEGPQASTAQAGEPVTDALLADVIRWAERDGAVPARDRVKDRLGVGSARADRLRDDAAAHLSARPPALVGERADDARTAGGIERDGQGEARAGRSTTAVAAPEQRSPVPEDA